MLPHVNIVRVPDWSFEFVGRDGAGYYGARWCWCVGPYLIFIGSLAQAERDAWWNDNIKLPHPALKKEPHP